jgi:hypothetical protein
VHGIKCNRVVRRRIIDSVAVCWVDFMNSELSKSYFDIESSDLVDKVFLFRAINFNNCI